MFRRSRNKYGFRYVIAHRTSADSRTLRVTVFDPNLQKDVVIAINDAGMDFNSRVEGTAITVSLPKVTMELRNNLVKLVKKYKEDGKVAIRNQRKPALQSINKAKNQNGFSKDDIQRWQKELDARTNEYCNMVDKLAEEKEKEIMAD